MSGIIGSKLNHRGSGLVGSLGTDGQHLLSSGAGKTNVFETVTAAEVTAADATAIRQDITTLALKQAVQENSTKFNLPNSAICTFEADADFNLAGSTTIARDASEYISSISYAVGAFSDDSNTVLLMHMDDTSLIDSATTGDAPHTVTLNGDVTRSATQSKFGSYSAYFDGSGDYLSIANNAQHEVMANTNDWTVELWFRPNGANPVATLIGNGGEGTANYNGWNIQTMAAPKWYPTFSNTSPSFASWSPDWGVAATQAFSATTWYHLALLRDGGEFRSYINGTKLTDVTGYTTQTVTSTRALEIGRNVHGDRYFAGYMDEIRISNSARYTANFTPNNVASTSATGTALGTTNVPTSAVTEVSGVMLMKNSSGTNTLGTDVKAYFTADNSNWTEAASYTDAGTFSDTTKMIKLGKTTCTQGSDVRWKITFANQSAGSKIAEIYGIGLNY